MARATLASASPQEGRCRVDWQTPAGRVYFVDLTGAAAGEPYVT